MHPALFDRLRDAVGLRRLADHLGDAGGRHHQLDGRDPAAANPRQEPLADHAAQNAGHDLADEELLVRRKQLDQAADGLVRVEGVHRREHEVTGLARLQGDAGRLLVSQLADQDHVRVLAQDAAHALEVRVDVEPDLTLLHDAGVVAVDDLDRILQRDDVLAPSLVDVVDHRGERGRLPGAGRAGDEDEAALLVGELLHARRQAEAFKRRHLSGHEAEARTRYRPSGGSR